MSDTALLYCTIVAFVAAFYTIVTVLYMVLEIRSLRTEKREALEKVEHYRLLYERLSKQSEECPAVMFDWEGKFHAMRKSE